MNDRPRIDFATAQDAELILAELAEVKAMLRAAQITPAPEWGTIPQAAEYYGKSKDTIRKWAREGTIEARGSGGARQVRLLPR